MNIDSVTGMMKEKNSSTISRREALQGLTGITALTMLHGSAMATEVAMNNASATQLADLVKKFAPMEFTTDWLFHRGDVQGAELASLDDSGWRSLDVPHDWSIEDLPRADWPGAGESTIWKEGNAPLKAGPFDVYASEGQSATGWTVGGVGWYRKTFDRPETPRGGKVELRFDGVYMNCDVWFNGTHLGNHPYGYTPFAYDVTLHLKDGKNIVAVKVNNSGHTSRWYSGSGIFRKVWLSVAGGLRIPEYGVSVTTPLVAKDVATVNLDVTLENRSRIVRPMCAHGCWMPLEQRPRRRKPPSVLRQAKR